MLFFPLCGYKHPFNTHQFTTYVRLFQSWFNTAVLRLPCFGVNFRHLFSWRCWSWSLARGGVWWASLMWRGFFPFAIIRASLGATQTAQCLPGPLPSDSSTCGGSRPQHLLTVGSPSLPPPLLTRVLFIKGRAVASLPRGCVFGCLFFGLYHAISVF